ncbi:MAG: LytTR family transcriptional regulator DNA-binding domain-containing protein [Coprobacillus cateniformis]|uniref:hypothetical protein n=1 Tax=Longibaculum muris TaxID=1796628 RepID=UPI003AB2A8B1|nr:LytTR family transcriptional regulator DNA-binding domain-containing protein [Coprobacillus cateniformis]
MNECFLDNQKQSEHIIFKTATGYQKIYIHEIEYIEAQNKHCCFYLVSKEQVEVMIPLYKLEEQLNKYKIFFNVIEVI